MGTYNTIPEEITFSASQISHQIQDCTHGIQMYE